MIPFRSVVNRRRPSDSRRGNDATLASASVPARLGSTPSVQAGWVTRKGR